MRLIDADVLKPDTKTFTSAYSEELTEFYSQKAIANAPTIEAEPMRHGEWIRKPSNLFQCSNCHMHITIPDRVNAYYCKYCGAKMDGKDV